MDAGMGMGGGDDLIALLMAHHIRSDGAALDIEDVTGIFLHIVDKA